MKKKPTLTTALRLGKLEFKINIILLALGAQIAGAFPLVAAYIPEAITNICSIF